MAVYKGFNTVGRAFPPWGIDDIELVKQDLLNHFMTRKGERVMMPTYGSRIHDLVFEPYDETTVSDVEDDVKDVIGHDPRVKIVTMLVTELDYGILVEVELYFIKQDTADHLLVKFERDISEDF